jgi:hypothetical protein
LSKFFCCFRVSRSDDGTERAIPARPH